MQSQETLDPRTGLEAAARQDLLNEAQPSITWLNMTGDVSITWDDSNRDAVMELVKKKMAQGYSFFVIKPRALRVLGTKKEPLKKPEQLKNACGVVVPDSQVQSMLADMAQTSAKVDDADIEVALQKGHLRLVKPASAKTQETVKRASTPQEVVKHQSVAIRPVVGG